MSGKGGSERVKAYRIKAKQRNEEPLTEDEEAWIENYEQTKVTKDGASASERVVHIEERAAATGDHVHPEALAALARAEGLRADTLLKVAAQAIVQSNQQHLMLVQIMMQRMGALETAHVAMLDAIREERLARVEAETAARFIGAGGEEGGEEGDDMRMMQFVLQAMSQFRAGQPQKKKKVKKKPEKPLGSID